jgi:hypothetical protein
MNTSRLIEVRTDLHHADQEVKALMRDSMELATKANFASDNVNQVIKTWGEDHDMVEVAKDLMYTANLNLVDANRLVSEAISRYTELSDALAALHHEVEA